MFCQDGKDLKLHGRKCNRFATTRDVFRTAVDCQIADRNHGSCIAFCPPNDGAKPGEELPDSKRFGEVVISTHVEQVHPIVFCLFRGSNNHRYRASLSKFLEQGDPVHVRKHQVEHDGVEHFGCGYLEACCAIGGFEDGVLVFPQCPSGGRSCGFVIFNDQHAKRDL